jgi:hypothetical protein
MPATQLFIGQCASFPLASKGSDGALRPCSFVIHTSDYAVGCANINGLKVVGVRGKSAGAFDVTITGHSADGTAMTPTTLSFTVAEVPVPQADHFETGAISISDGYLQPTDPGSDTVTGTM